LLSSVDFGEHNLHRRDIVHSIVRALVQHRLHVIVFRQDDCGGRRFTLKGPGIAVHAQFALGGIALAVEEVRDVVATRVVVTHDPRAAYVDFANTSVTRVSNEEAPGVHSYTSEVVIDAPRLLSSLIV